MTDTRLILVRHGESHGNAQKFIAGLRTCTGLTDHGRWQAERLRDRLLDSNEVIPTALYSSSYPRALETARIIAPALGSLPVTVDAQWGEHDPGPDCDGLTYTEFVERFGQPNWDGDPFDVTYPGGETKAAFYDRVLGMKAGDRPPFPFPGAWIYLGDTPVLHLVDVSDGQRAARAGHR